MQHLLILSIVALMTISNANSQAPQALNYQAIARDASGLIYGNQNISLRITITDGSGGTTLYQETHNTNTNQFGLFTLSVGLGTPITGSFATISWGSVNAWMAVEYDPTGGTNFTLMGQSQLLSVPYALYAADGNPGPQGPPGPQGIQGPPGQDANLNGTTNYVVKFTPNGTTGGNSQIFDNGNNIGINTTSPVGKLHIKGNADVSQLIIDANSTQSNTNPLIRLRNNIGNDLMWINSDTSINTFVGFNAGRFNDISSGFGIENTFIGSEAGFSNTLGIGNTVLGKTALFSNTTGYSNTANGVRALHANTAAYGNTAIGYQAIPVNTTGNFNTAVGITTLGLNNNGDQNTAIGGFALLNNINGGNNSALGFEAGYTFSIGSGNTFLGAQSDANAAGITNATAIGNNAIVDASGKVRVGNATVTSIGGQVGWTTFSDGRFKQNVSEEIPGLSFILKLRPVTYTTNITEYNRHIGLDEIKRLKEAQGKNCAC